MNRVTFLIDGFNLYHSIIDLARLQNLRVKWLNIHSLCSSFLYLINRDANLAEIYYFSAFAHHLNDPSVIRRHQDYVECLKSTGIIPEMGRFKPKHVTCPLRSQLVKSNPKNVKCPLRRKFIKHEEKETDIAIAARLFKVVFKNKCDTVVLLTGDTEKFFEQLWLGRDKIKKDTPFATIICYKTDPQATQESLKMFADYLGLKPTADWLTVSADDIEAGKERSRQLGIAVAQGG